jgi:hypothetical protein
MQVGLCLVSFYMLLFSGGRAIAQAVSLRSSTVASRVWYRFKSCGICGGQSSTRASFLLVLRFPLPISIPPTASHSSIIRRWCSGTISGRRTKWTQSYPTPRKLKKNTFLCVYNSEERSGRKKEICPVLKCYQKILVWTR